MSNEPGAINAEGSIFDKGAASKNRIKEFKAGVVGAAQTSDEAAVKILQQSDEALRAERQKLAVEAGKQTKADVEQMGQTTKKSSEPKKKRWW